VRRDSVGRVLNGGVSHGDVVKCLIFLASDRFVAMKVERLLGGTGSESVSCGRCLSRC
jgi:hypothetical protein